MAPPNLKSPTTVTGKTAAYGCTATLASALANAGASGKALKVNSVRAANIDGTAAFDVDLTLFRASTHTYLASTVSVPADATLILVNRDEYFYLEEGDALHARASTTGRIDLTICYDEIA